MIELAGDPRHCETLRQRTAGPADRSGQMNNQVDNQRHNASQTGQLWRFEACHQTNENKIRRTRKIHKNSKQPFFRKVEGSVRTAFAFLIRLLFACLPGRLIANLQRAPPHRSKWPGSRTQAFDHHQRFSFSSSFSSSFRTLISSPFKPFKAFESFKMSNKANPSNLSPSYPCTIEPTSSLGLHGRCKFILHKLDHLIRTVQMASYRSHDDLCASNDRRPDNCSTRPRSNLRANRLILMPLIALALLGPDVCHANESCFGGIETFEKTGMYDFNTEIKPRGTLLQQNDQALTRDCINQCKNQPICASFGLDYTKFICAAYTHSSSQTLAPNYQLRDKLQLTNTTNYFEKVCYKGMSREEYQRICGLERLWAFERVMDAFLDGFEDLSIPGVANKEDCAKQCLIETTFSCRSADYDHSSKVCRLSREDRRTQPQAFRQVFGSKRDYLENQCAPPGPTTCLYDAKRETGVITMDSLIYADNLVDCQQKCDKETTFNCRAFSLSGNKCYLSGDDTISLANSALPSKPGFVYGEKHCVTEHCSPNGVFTYEKITGHVLKTAILNPMQVHQSNVGITGACKQFCDQNPMNCPAFQVNYMNARCDYLDRNSQGRQLELVERDGENYFERICLRVPSLSNSACRDKFWMFERIIGYELNPVNYDRVYEQVLSRRDCEEYCLLEKTFSCRSALYNDENAVCKLSRYDRRTKASDFIRSNNFKLSYLENQCVPTYSKCEYESTPNAAPTYTDLVVNFTGYAIKDERQGKQLCENRCNESREFLCRSYSFYPATSECFLSGDDTISGYFNALINKNGMEYSERKCTKRDELEQGLNQLGDQVNFDDKTDVRNGDSLDDLGFRTTPIDLNQRNVPDNTRQSIPESYTTPSTVYDTSRQAGDSSSFAPHKPNDDAYNSRDNLDDHHNHSLLDRQNNQKTTSPFGSSQFPSTRDGYDSRSNGNQAVVSPNLSGSKFGGQTNRSTYFNSEGFPNNETDHRTTSGYSTSIRSGPGFNAGNAKSTTTKWSSQDGGGGGRLKETINRNNNSLDSLSLNNNKCPPNNEFTFERIVNFEPVGGQLFFLHSDSKSSAITMDCMRLCKINVNCTGFILDYLKHACHGIYQMYSFSKLDLRLTPGKDFFEGVCIESNRVDCDKSWMFDRVVDQNVMGGQLQPRLVLNYIDKHNCKMACLGETRFPCRSISYDLTTRECKLFDESRDSGEVQLQFTRGTEYMENQCNSYEPSACKYNSIERDLTITSITKSVPGHSTYYCEQLCNSEREFNCRSYTYLDQTIITHGNLCLLSADSRYTSLNGSMKYRPRALFAEKDCRDASGRKGKKSFISEITGRNSPPAIDSPALQRPVSPKSSFKGLTHHQFNGSHPSFVNRIGSKGGADFGNEIAYDEPAVELPNFNNKNRDCVYNEFTFEKTYGKQIRFSKRERVISPGNVLNSRGKRFTDPFNQTRMADSLDFGESIISNVFSPLGKKAKRNIQQIQQTNVQNSPAMVSLTADCQDECLRRGMACRSFIVEYGPSVGTEQCFILEDAAEERPDVLDYSKYGAYFEKICLREKHCNKLWTFDRVTSFTLDMPAKRQFQANTKLDCEDLCLAEEKFVCKSATFNYENRICKLYNENRRTKPGVFKATRQRMDYLENQCVKEPTTCQYKEQLNSELPAVDKMVQAWNLEECTHYCNSEKLFNCKSVNFNHYSRECSMSSDELSSVNIINSVKFSPIMLSPKLNSVYSEKGSCEHISVQCNNENMVLQLNFDSAFFGRIYSKANPTQCYLTGNGENHLDFPIPLNQACGTRQEGAHNFINEVVIQQHAVIMTDLDKTIKVLCSFEQNDQTISLNRNNPNRPGLDVKTNVNARNNEIDTPNSIVTNTAAPPTIVMKILDRTGSEANYVNLGDELILKIEIKERTNSPFGIFARNLFAKSSNNEILHLLDSDGCPIDPTVFPEMKIDPKDKISLYSKFKAFRFPSTGVVNFEVQIKFCPNRCPAVSCNDLGSNLGGNLGGNNINSINNNLSQEQIVQTNYGGVKGTKSGFGRLRRETSNEFESEELADESLDTQESTLKPVIQKENTTKEFQEFALPRKTEDKQAFLPVLPEPQFLQTSLRELNSSKPKPELSSQVIANSNGIVYPSTNPDLLSYTITSYQPNHPVYKQRDLSYSGNGYSYVDPVLAAKSGAGYMPNQFYSAQDTGMANGHMMQPSNVYNPFAYPSSGLNSFNNFGKAPISSIRPMVNENMNKNFWHPATLTDQNKPVNNLVNNPPNVVNNQAANKVKFVPPRPLARPADSLPAKEDINELASDRQYSDQMLPLHQTILVNDKKKIADRKKSMSTIEKKNKAKASLERNYQPQYIEHVCNTGPVILYTSLLVTLIYLGLTACGYFYYSRYVKRYADQKLLVSGLGAGLPTKSNACDTFNFQLPPVHRTNQLNFDNRPGSLFHSNLNGTIRSLSSSTMSGYNQVFTQNFQTKAKARRATNQPTQPKLAQEPAQKLRSVPKEADEAPKAPKKPADNYKVSENFKLSSYGMQSKTGNLHGSKFRDS